MPRVLALLTTATLMGCTPTATGAEPVTEPAHAEAPNAASGEDADVATAWIDAAVGAAGLVDPKQLEIRLSFRGTPYRLWLDGRRSVYQRQVKGPSGVRTDRLDGDHLTVSIAGRAMQPSPQDEAGLRRSLNSVGYFALLPRPLQDDAVLARSLGVTELEGERWNTVEVRFREEGGGDDHDDVFRYWLHPRTHRIGYLAYTFATGKGGVRLRKATRYHEVDGVVLVDWANHGREGQGVTIDEAVASYQAGELPLLSQIELEHVEIRRGVPAPALTFRPTAEPLSHR